MSDSAKVLVCDKCLRAGCWYGEFMCDGAGSAGRKIMTIGQLQALPDDGNREHQDYWSDKKMIEVYGDASREFRSYPPNPSRFHGAA